MRIRPATRHDIPKLIALERSSDTAAHWGEGQYTALFDPSSPRRLALIAEFSGQDIVPASQSETLCGFIVALAATAEWEVENVAVDLPVRRSGVGSQLLSALLNAARDQLAESIFLEVRASNVPARKLYEKHGFREFGRRSAYYCNPTEDAVLLRLKISPAALENA